MRKTISIILLFAMLILMTYGQASLAAEAQQSNESVHIPNPWRTVTGTEAASLCPGSLRVPEGAEKAQWSVMEVEGEAALIQLDFDLNGNSYAAREQVTNDRAANISGLHYTWTIQSEMVMQNWEESAKVGTYYRYIGKDERADLCVWYDRAKGVSYSLSVTAKDLDGFDLQTIAETLYAPTASAAHMTLSFEDQRHILEENRSLWAFGKGDDAPDWYYAFTDLDHNGLLEVISASTQGTGIFTFAHFYEVLPDGSGVKALYHADMEIEGPDDWPEIIQNSLPCYYDRSADRYYYVCSNDIRDGAAHSMSRLAALCLKDGVAEWEYLASVDVQWTEAGEQRTYMDGAGNPISEQDYNSAIERRFAGMEQTEMKLNWTAITQSMIAAETERQSGDRYEVTVTLDGMETAVQLEQIRNDTIGFEMGYAYERFDRHSEAHRERFVLKGEDSEHPEVYLEVTRNTADAETTAASIVESLSNEYNPTMEECTLEHAGSCIRINADVDKSGQMTIDRLQVVYIISTDDGCLVAWGHNGFDSADAFDALYRSMMQTFSAIGKKLTDEQALAAIKRYCIVNNPDLKSAVNAGEYQVYWDVISSTDSEIVVLFRSYTGAEIRYHIDPVAGETYVTEYVFGITPEEQVTEEVFNARDYLFSLPGTWQTASVVFEEDGTAYPAYHVRFTDTEILYGHMKDGAFVITHTDTIRGLGKTATGGFKVQAKAANGVQYTFQTSERDNNVLEYYETWNETDFSTSYRGGMSLSRCG